MIQQQQQQLIRPICIQKNTDLHIIAELQKYGSIKSTIEQLGQEADMLRNEIASLKAQKQDILARLIYSRQIYQIYSGPPIY